MYYSPLSQFQLIPTHPKENKSLQKKVAKQKGKTAKKENQPNIKEETQFLSQNCKM